MTRSALYVGTVRHRRHRPRPNAFRYGVHWVLIDVDELPLLDATVRGFGYGRRAPVSFRDTDHLGPADVPVRLKLARLLADRGYALPTGRVQVLCNLRVLGHVFNPVSWWFCHDGDGRLTLVVAEVANTFGESHCYVLDQLDAQPDGTVRATAPKVFHVSPFLPIDGLTYRFAFLPPGERVLVHLDVDDPAGRVLDATQDARRLPLTAANLAATLLRQPMVSLRTVYLIHRQALHLWRLRVPFHRKPPPPAPGHGRLDRPTPDHVTPTAVVAEPEPSAATRELAS